MLEYPGHLTQSYLCIVAGIHSGESDKHGPAECRDFDYQQNTVVSNYYLVRFTFTSKHKKNITHFQIMECIIFIIYLVRIIFICHMINTVSYKILHNIYFMVEHYSQGVINCFSIYR